MDNYSLQKPLNMAPTGIATFAKSDLATDIYHLNADVAVLGAPSIWLSKAARAAVLALAESGWVQPALPTKRAAPMIRNASSTIWMPDVGML